MIMNFIIIFASAYATSAAVLPSTTSMAPLYNRDVYSSKPSEILPIQPLLIYPLAKEEAHKGRALFKDNDIIYITLLKPKSYQPKRIKSQIALKNETLKDIFYVKSVANGQFSPNRLKMYRLPEFYTIVVYKNNQLME